MPFRSNLNPQDAFELIKLVCSNLNLSISKIQTLIKSQLPEIFELIKSDKYAVNKIINDFEDSHKSVQTYLEIQEVDMRKKMEEQEKRELEYKDEYEREEQAGEQEGQESEEPKKKTEISEFDEEEEINMQIPIAMSYFKEDKELLTELYQAIIRWANTNNIGCILPVLWNEDNDQFEEPKPEKDVFDFDPQNIHYNIYQCNGYWVLRYKNSQSIIRTIYLHQLAILIDGKRLFKSRFHTINEKQVSVKYSASHLCGQRECCNGLHLISEPHAINISRIYCWKEECLHLVKCIRPKKYLLKKIELVQEKYLHVVEEGKK